MALCRGAEGRSRQGACDREGGGGRQEPERSRRRGRSEHRQRAADRRPARRTRRRRQAGSARTRAALLDGERQRQDARNSGQPRLDGHRAQRRAAPRRSEEHTSELQSLMRISYAVFCLKKKKNKETTSTSNKRERTTKR